MPIVGHRYLPHPTCPDRWWLKGSKHGSANGDGVVTGAFLNENIHAKQPKTCLAMNGLGKNWHGRKSSQPQGRCQIGLETHT